jgi:hypothetical protein
MAQVIPATYDGTTFHPDSPVAIPPNTRVLLTVEPVSSTPLGRKNASFIDTALSLRIDGPSDWSSRVDHYLYGDLVASDD